MTDAESTVVAVDNVHKRYTLPRESLWQVPGEVQAINGVSFTIEKGICATY